MGPIGEPPAATIDGDAAVGDATRKAMESVQQMRPHMNFDLKEHVPPHLYRLLSTWGTSQRLTDIINWAGEKIAGGMTVEQLNEEQGRRGQSAMALRLLEDTAELDDAGLAQVWDSISEHMGERPNMPLPSEMQRPGEQGLIAAGIAALFSPDYAFDILQAPLIEQYRRKAERDQVAQIQYADALQVWKDKLDGLLAHADAFSRRDIVRFQENRRSIENELQRQHQFSMEGTRHRNTLTEIQERGAVDQQRRDDDREYAAGQAERDVQTLVSLGVPEEQARQDVADAVLGRENPTLELEQHREFFKRMNGREPSYDELMNQATNGQWGDRLARADERNKKVEWFDVQAQADVDAIYSRIWSNERAAETAAQNAQTGAAREARLAADAARGELIGTIDKQLTSLRSQIAAKRKLVDSLLSEYREKLEEDVEEDVDEEAAEMVLTEMMAQRAALQELENRESSLIGERDEQASQLGGAELSGRPNYGGQSTEDAPQARLAPVDPFRADPTLRGRIGK